MNISFENKNKVIKNQAKKDNMPWLISLSIALIVVVCFAACYFILSWIYGYRGNMFLIILGAIFSALSPLSAIFLVVTLFVINNQFKRDSEKSSITKIDIDKKDYVQITVRNEKDFVFISQNISNVKFIDKGNVWLLKFRFNYWVYAPKKISEEFDNEVRSLIGPSSK